MFYTFISYESKENFAIKHETFWRQKRSQILAGRTVEYVPLNCPLTALVVTERCNVSFVSL